MRTTIDIPDVLYKAVRTRTAAEGTTLRYVTVALLGDWLRKPDWRPLAQPEDLARSAKPQKAKPHRRLACFGIARPDPSLNISHDWADIEKSIEEGWAQEVAEKEARVREQ